MLPSVAQNRFRASGLSIGTAPKSVDRNTGVSRTPIRPTVNRCGYTKEKDVDAVSASDEMYHQAPRWDEWPDTFGSMAVKAGIDDYRGALVPMSMSLLEGEG